MNKFISKIIGATLAFAMMIGGAVGINAAKEATEVNAASTGNYSLVTSTTGISAGDTVIFLNHDGNNALKAISTTSTKYGTLCSVTTSNNTVELSNANVAEFTVEAGNSAGSFSFKGVSSNSAAGGTAITNYLYWTSGNSLNQSSTKDAKTSWTLNSYATNTGMVVANCSTTTRIVRFNSDRFACYTTGAGTGIDIYKKSTAATPTVSSVQASIKEGTYYTGSKLSESDFNVTVKWTQDKADTNPTEGFTWTVNDVEDGTLSEGDNEVFVTYAEVNSTKFNVVGTTVHATAVNISEDTATLEVIGETTTLNATITPANAVETITWSSSDENVATVDENGEVTAVGAGTATIAATAGSASDTCEVTVYNRSKATISFGKKDYNIAKPTETQDEISNALIDGYDFNLLNAHNSGATYDYIMFATNNLGTEESLVANKTAIPGAITRIVFNIRVGSSGKAIYNAILSNSSVTTTVSDSTYTRTGAGTLTIEADPSSNYHFFAISCVTAAGNGQLASIDVFYVPTTVKTDFHALETQTTLSYRYEKNAQDEFSYSDISIRFGALVSKNLWDEINTIYDVAGFGVMIASGNTIKDFETFEEYAEFAVPANQNPNIASELIDYYVENDGTFEIPLSNNSYYWNLRFSIPESDMHVTYTAAAYIKIGSEIIFMQKARESVETLALDYLQNRGCDATTAGGSLKNIVDQSQMS